MKRIWLPLLLAVTTLASVGDAQEKVREPYFGIQVVDDESGRGVPLVELRTVNDIALITDSAGWVAFDELGLMNREVFFAISSPGYEYPPDGFGIRGVRLTTTPGKAATVKLKRTNIAQRLYRVTGQGIYRDSQLLGLPVPKGIEASSAGVLGQDSVQAVPYRGRIFWLWGDTNVPNYPLGNFQTTAATSALPGDSTFSPDDGVPLSYFLAPQGDRVRAMVPLKGPGPIWLFGLLTVPDADGDEALLAHYSRRKNLGEALEQGLVRYSDEHGVFEKIREIDLAESWRFPRGNAFLVREGDVSYYYFSQPLAHTRVRADWESVTDPARYEAYTFDAKSAEYRWQREAPPTTQAEEQKLLAAGNLKPAQALYDVVDAGTSKPVHIHHASIAWNDFRKQWVMIAVEQGGRGAPSYLGEIWYAEAGAPTGPWRKAVKIGTHPRYSFYNPRQHTSFDADGGRTIYFEATYTRTFSGNPSPTPRYEYNQLMYRLDLGDKRLEVAR
jgi:hypothetical protein